MKLRPQRRRQLPAFDDPSVHQRQDLPRKKMGIRLKLGLGIVAVLVVVGASYQLYALGKRRGIDQQDAITGKLQHNKPAGATNATPRSLLPPGHWIYAGAVTKVSAQEITIKSRNGELHTAKVDAQTKISHGQQSKLTTQAIKVGAQVAITGLTGKDDVALAQLIRIQN